MSKRSKDIMICLDNKQKWYLDISLIHYEMSTEGQVETFNSFGNVYLNVARFGKLEMLFCVNSREDVENLLKVCWTTNVLYLND